MVNRMHLRNLRISRLLLKIAHSNSFYPLSSILQFFLDTIALSCTAMVVSYWRFVYQVHPDPMGATQDTVFRVIPLVFLIQAIVGYVVGIYRRRWRYGSFDEIAGLLTTTTISIAILLFLRFFDNSINPYPRSVIVVGGFAGVFLMAANRYVWRLIREQLRRPTEETATKILVYGAGEGGIQMVNTLLRNPSSRYLPVGFIDDNPDTHRLTISGVPVIGGRESLPEARGKTGASTLLIAIPSADSSLINDISTRAQKLGMDVKIVPPVQNLNERPLNPSDIRDLTDEDLLGRRKIHTDLQQISDYIVNRRVLVTGAGGSIGSELCRQLARFNPAELIMLDRDESALHEVQLSIHGRALLDTPQTVLADLRDAATIQHIFETRRPEVVFHAAALKHLPLLERYPLEAYQTNVLGTRYFMTIFEAVQLVIQAGAIGSNGEVLVLDMGEPVSIYDVATQLVRNSQKSVPIEIVGLRSGEKVHEELFGEGEIDTRPQHPLISHVPVSPIDAQVLDAMPQDARSFMIQVVQS